MSEHRDDEIKQIAAAVANPCPECPFNRSVKPKALGGSSVYTYVGQIYGPFVIACHMHIDFQDPAWRDVTKYAQTPQCAGAAIIRANVGVDVLMPDAIPRAAPNRTTVFSNIVEFVAHHHETTIMSARRILTPKMITELVQTQIDRAKRGEAP